MKLTIDRLLADGLRLELPREDGPPDHVELSRGVGARGTYAHDAAWVLLEKMSADELDAASLLLHLAAGRTVAVAPLALRRAEVDLRIARAPLLGRARLTGRIAASSATGRALALELGAATRAVFESLEARGVEYLRQPEGTRAALSSVEASNIRVDLGGARIAADGLTVEGLRVRDGAAGALEIEACRAEARGFEVTLGERVRVRCARLDLPKGLRYDAARLTVPAVAWDEIEVDLMLAAPAEGRSAAPDQARTPPDLRVLDGLAGWVHADVTVDAKIPFLKRRLATHEFRVPIDRGTIDFHELERDLSLLEDAVLDFKVKGDRLVLEKDIPLIPFDEETIVYFPLDEEEQHLARGDRVRLRTLASPKLPARPAKEGPSSFELVRIDADPIEASLRLLGPSSVAWPGGRVRLGTDAAPAIGELRVRGAIRHRPADAPQPGEIRADARDLRAALERAEAGAWALSAAEVTLAELADAWLALEGLRPTRARASLKGGAMRDIALERRPLRPGT
jgi:hypothetical protein